MTTPRDTRTPLPVDAPFGGARPGPCGANAPAPGPVNGLAVASLVLGLMGLSLVTVVPALVCGHLARRRIRAGQGSGAGLATAGIVLGWVGVGLWTFLALRVGLAVATA